MLDADAARLLRRFLARSARGCGTRLAEAGATTPARVGLGHASLSKVERYTKAAERKRLAGQGMPKLIEADGDNRPERKWIKTHKVLKTHDKQRQI